MLGAAAVGMRRAGSYMNDAMIATGGAIVDGAIAVGKTAIGVAGATINFAGNVLVNAGKSVIGMTKTTINFTDNIINGAMNIGKEFAYGMATDPMGTLADAAEVMMLMGGIKPALQKVGLIEASEDGLTNGHIELIDGKEDAINRNRMQGQQDRNESKMNSILNYDWTKYLADSAAGPANDKAQMIGGGPAVVKEILDFSYLGWGMPAQKDAMIKEELTNKTLGIIEDKIKKRRKYRGY